MAESPGPNKPIRCPFCRKADLIRTREYLTTQTGVFQELRYCPGCLNAVGVLSARGDDDHFVFGKHYPPRLSKGGSQSAVKRWPFKGK